MNFIEKYKIEIMKQFMGMKEIITVYCAASNMPYVECGEETFNDRVYVFESEKMLEVFLRSCAEKKIPLRGVKYREQDKLVFFTTLLSFNIDELVFMNESGRHIIKLSDIVRKQVPDNLPPGAKPVENPQLKLSGAYFVQEASRKVPQEEKRNLRELQEELSANIVKGIYLIPAELVAPVKAGEEKQAGTGDGKTREQQFRMPLIKSPKGEIFQPLFTDMVEFARYNKDKKFRALAVPFNKLGTFAVKESKGFMLNPGGFHIVIARRQPDGVPAKPHLQIDDNAG